MAGNDFEMITDKDETTVESLSKSFLSAFQTLQFSKVNKTDEEIADLERRCLFMKYMICKNNINEEVAGTLLQNELGSYTNVIDNQSGLNNYWKQFSSLNINTDNNPMEWKSNLTDPNLALQFIEPSPCTNEKTVLCKTKQFTDRDVSKLMDLWKNCGSSPRTRKVPRQEQNHTPNTKSHNNEKKPKVSDFRFIKKSTSSPREEIEHSINSRQNFNSPRQFSKSDRQNTNSDRQFSNYERPSSNSQDRPQSNFERQNCSSDRQFSNFERQNSNPERHFSNFDRPNGNADRQFCNIDRQNTNSNRQFSNYDRPNSNSQERQYSNPNSDRQFSNYDRQNFNSQDRQYSNPNSNRQYSNSDRQYSNSERNLGNRMNPVKPEPKREEKSEDKKFSGFLTARTALNIAQANKNNRQQGNNRQQYQQPNRPPIKKSLGGKALNSPYVNPFKEEQPKEEESPEITDERLKNIEPKMIELIRNEIMDCGSPITWDDIAGLEHAKRIIKEIVVFPMLRPDIFTGLRRPPKGILLFGPPGTGKTLIGKCIASQSKSTFFSISASSLTSKWVGEGEKMVRALFAVAQVEQPSVVFIDEIDSLLCQRSETEHESSRRMKTEFLVQLDGAATGDEDRILVIGATNRPYELDEAARRRLVKRLYVPLPELEARAQIVRNLLRSERHNLTEEDVYKVAELSDGYSGADMTNLCKEASMGPIRSIPFDQLEGICKDDVRRLTFQDFKEALDTIRPSVSQKDLSVYIDWDRTYGTASAQPRI